MGGKPVSPHPSIRIYSKSLFFFRFFFSSFFPRREESGCEKTKSFLSKNIFIIMAREISERTYSLVSPKKNPPPPKFSLYYYQHFCTGR